MDIRGIEVTNQLRSAIRAKLLELGVRYDEELPDYILVMVVNKKTRQQMHEDLRLFLEGSTSPFVEWLHDQVLKKLQKVTIAKKKTSRELLPAVIVKQEEERKKRKNNALAVTEETPRSETIEKVEKASEVRTKEEKPMELPRESSGSSERTAEEDSSITIQEETQLSEEASPQRTGPTEPEREIIAENLEWADKGSENPWKSVKRSSEGTQSEDGREKRQKSEETLKNDECEESAAKEEEEEKEEEAEEEEDEEEDEKMEKRLKSCVNKPKVTSVVSIKTRLGEVSPRKKFEIHRNRFGDNSRKNQRNDRPSANFGSFRNNISRSDNHDEDRHDYSRSGGNGYRDRRSLRTSEVRNRQFFERNEDKRSPKIGDNDKQGRNVEKSTLNVRDRLGTSKNLMTSKKIDIKDDGGTMITKRNTIKNRLGPIRNRELSTMDDEEDETKNKEDEEEDEDATIFHAGPVRSRIIAVSRPEIIDKRSNRDFDNNPDESSMHHDPEDIDAGKTIASKVIVTPRPLKPLQPVQKRATQSLLLRAVAEANQSVVKQKNPEPVLTDNKPRLKRQRPSGNREIGDNLSVHLNATKRLVMEKIQVQLSTEETEENIKSKQHTPHPVNEEHMGVVMSLFQRSDDNQKFLVTLNGYNNNVIKEKRRSAEEEEGEEEEKEEEEDRLEMEAPEDDEMAAPSPPNDFSDQTLLPTVDNDENDDADKMIIDENNENENIENFEFTDELPERKRRKLSPIVYERSRSKSPITITKKSTVSSACNEIFEKRPNSNVSPSSNTDKSREKCRYWPNCTLGLKCAYFHPGVPCSAFPTCKYGEKCIYKHPKCKFGLACTKLGCAFSHPKQQCKYHPFCTKPTCSYSHPAITPAVAVPGETTRTKFTWKRRD